MSRTRPDSRRRCRLLAAALALAVGLGGLSWAWAQGAFSLNSPVSFPVDI